MDSKDISNELPCEIYTSTDNSSISSTQESSSSIESIDSGSFVSNTNTNTDKDDSKLVKERDYTFKEVITSITKDKDTCIKFLQKHNVLAKEVLCPGPMHKGHRQMNCGKQMSIKRVKDRKDGVTWRCRRVHTIHDECNTYKIKDVKVSIRSNTWIEDSNLKLEEIVEMLYLWAHNRSIDEVHHELNISKKTLIEWYIYFRDVCTTVVLRCSEQIGGPGVEVEIDESKFGKRKYRKGRQVDGRWVFGGREKNDKSKIFMMPVDNRKKITLIPIIEKWIKKGSIIHSDCWASYKCLMKLGYTHLTVNHSKMFVNYRTGACTNKIESDWRHAKVGMPSYGCHKGLHYGYLAEFLWRRKFHSQDLFMQILKDINEVYVSGEVTEGPNF